MVDVISLHADEPLLLNHRGKMKVTISIILFDVIYGKQKRDLAFLEPDRDHGSSTAYLADETGQISSPEDLAVDELEVNDWVLL